MSFCFRTTRLPSYHPIAKKSGSVPTDFFATFFLLFFRVYLRQFCELANDLCIIRQAVWAFEAVRKEIQKQFSKKHRIYFKKSRHLLLKHQDKLKEDELQQVFIMLDISPTLSSAYFLKEHLYDILKESDPNRQKKLFSDWIQEAMESDIPSFVKCAKTYYNWFTPITNSFFCPYTNGFTEGCNNKIKVLKRNAYGLHDFKRFRNRILFMFSHKNGGAV